MYVDNEKRFIFFHIPKTAGQSVLVAFGVEDPNAYPSHELEKLTPEQMSWLRFAVVRNPFDRVLSAYKFSLKRIALQTPEQNARHPVRQQIMEAGYKSFSEFVEQGMTEETLTRNLHFRSQMRWVKAGQVNYIGRFETLDTDMARIGALIGMDLKLGYVNASSDRKITQKYIRKKGYRAEYTDATRDRIAALYADELDFLNYRF